MLRMVPLVSGESLGGVKLAGQRGCGRPPAPSRGGGRPFPLRPQPRESFGTRRLVTHDRTVARWAVARTRQVTVTDIICGVDVSSTHLKPASRDRASLQRFAKRPSGSRRWPPSPYEHEVTLVAMEATGGYEKKPFALLWAQGLPCAILNPRMVRRFAEAMGVLEKTDRIDAGVIAWCAEAKRVGPTEPASPAQHRLRALVVRLRQLTAVRTAQTNQQRLVDDPRCSPPSRRSWLSSPGKSARLRPRSPASSPPIRSGGARPGFPPNQGRRSHRRRPDGRTALDRPDPQQGHLQARRLRAARQRQRQEHRKASGARRTRNRARPPLRRRRDRPPTQSRLRRLPPPPPGKPKKVVRVALAHKLLVNSRKARDARLALMPWLDNPASLPRRFAAREDRAQPVGRTYPPPQCGGGGPCEAWWRGRWSASSRRQFLSVRFARRAAMTPADFIFPPSRQTGSGRGSAKGNGRQAAP